MIWILRGGSRRRLDVVSLAANAASNFTVTGNTLTLATSSSGTLAVTSAGALNLTGAAVSTWDIGANTLSLQTTGNGAITTGTGLITSGGSLTFSGTTARIITGPSTGGLTMTVASGPLTLSTTTTGAMAFNSAGALTKTSTGTSSWANTSGSLTLSTVASGALALTSVGALNLTGAAASTWSVTAGGLIVNATSNNLALQTTTSGNITLAPAGTGSVQLTSGVTTGTTTTSGLSLVADSLQSGYAGYIKSASTAGTGSGSSYLLYLDRSGANGSTTHTAYGLYSIVANTNGTSGTNYAGYFSATGATTANYGMKIVAPTTGAGSNYGLNITTPSTGTHNAALEIGTASTGSGTWAVYSSMNSNSYFEGNVGIGTNSPSQAKLTVNGNAAVLAQGDMLFYDTDNSNYAGFQATGATTQNVVYTLPGSAPAADGYALVSTTGGTLSWASAGGMTNPMTEAGDIIYGGASGTPTRLDGSLSDGYVLKYVLGSNTLTWAQDNTSAGGPTVSLSPSAADAESSANPSIWINDTGGGDLSASSNDRQRPHDNPFRGRESRRDFRERRHFEHRENQLIQHG